MILPKVDNLRILRSTASPDIICVVESFLNADIVDNEVAIQGYSIVRLDRNRHGGGILIYIKSQFVYTQLCNSYNTGARDVWHLLHRSTRALAPEG